jgi:hypothetical protein
MLALELKRRLEFASSKHAIEQKRLKLEELGLNNIAAEDLGLTLQELTDWYQDTFETISDGPRIPRRSARLRFNPRVPQRGRARVSDPPSIAVRKCRAIASCDEAGHKLRWHW